MAYAGGWLLAELAQPFGDSEQQVIDTMRVVCVLLGMVLLGVLGRLVLSMRSRRISDGDAADRRRFDFYVVSLFFFLLVAMLAELQDLGAPMTWMLPLRIVGLSFGIVAAMSTMHMAR